MSDRQPAPALAARLDELERRLADLEDERAIRELLTRFGYVMDVGSVDDFVDLFTPDGAVDLAMGSSYGEFAVTRRWEGSEQLHQFLADPEGLWDRSWYGNVMHVQGNNVDITVEGEDATARSYALSVVFREAKVQLIGASANRWRFRKVDGVWRIRERVFRPVAHEEFAAMLLGDGQYAAPRW
ncbi:nuclear transport factor 2 family protein [Nocardioides immobilis]|uniref:Nuclear transport factor 2 family protein n=1 Tax=Nocardioides immobilis TaxID=2049295 RepID=A0A417Y0Q5_9ACTN|nr:nuclear transport factor 2 family protein [Nocardioides immobilis]RHW26229.1 nuclear transport factor 2 family protein [Nocardioides immobilis]